MSVETILGNVMKEIPKVVAAGVVDMGSGMLLGVKTVDSHPQEVLDLVAAATKDLFEGDNVLSIENTFKRVRGLADNKERYFREIIVSSTNLIHYFSRMKSNETIVLTVVCRADANLGLLVTKARGIAAADRI